MKTSFAEQRDLQRTHYWQGQMLRAGDFRSQLNTEAQLRWWHNRALHNAYGVAVGFEASKTPKNGALTSIHLEPGVAYDSFGRALILQTAREIPLPDTNAATPSFTLLARYRKTAQFPDPRQTSGVCLSCCDESPDVETPDFVWKDTASLRVHDGVPLARLLKGFGARLHLFRLDPSLRPVTPKPLARPYLATGSTIPGSTAWGDWGLDTEILGLETVVDTSAAGFTRVPCYFATMDGLDLNLYQAASRSRPLFTHVQDATPNSFRFRTTLPAFFISNRQVRFTLPFVRWLGCQSTGDGDLCMAATAEKPCCG